MNKKKRTKYLLLAVILIYGAVITRFLMLSGDKESSISTPENIASFKPATYTVKKSFTITNDYRDPFLRTLSKKNLGIKTISSNQKSQKKEDTYYPTITYLGVISDAASSNKVLSLEINTKQYIVKLGSVVDSVQLISGNSKNIVVSYKGKRKRIDISD